MSGRKKIAVFPEPGAIGPLMNLIGICQGLRELGHESIFVIDPGIAGTAEKYGFQTTVLEDPTQFEILSALNDLVQRLEAKDRLVIYYAGHGQLRGDKGYWIFSIESGGG